MVACEKPSLYCLRTHRSRRGFLTRVEPLEIPKPTQPELVPNTSPDWLYYGVACQARLMRLPQGTQRIGKMRELWVTVRFWRFSQASPGKAWIIVWPQFGVDERPWPELVEWYQLRELPSYVEEPDGEMPRWAWA